MIQQKLPFCEVSACMTTASCGSIRDVSTVAEPLPDDIDALKAALTAERAARREFEARASGAEDAAARPAADTTTARPFTRARPVRAPLPAHLPRERVVLPSPTACPCCGGKLAKLGETITETLESIPRRYKVIQTVREKFSCRSCEAITQPPAPFHPIARGRAGPDLLATIMHGKFGEHQPLHRQSERFACEGIDLSVSTLADWIGACTATLSPLVTLIKAHALAAERLHGDDTTVPVLAKVKTITGRLWTYVRDDRPFGGPAPPAAIFFYSRDRGGEHPCRHLAGYAGIPQADAYAGFDDLYHPARKPDPILEAACWAHGRRKLFVLALPRHRSRSRPRAGSMRSSMSNATSTACPRRSGTPHDRSGSCRSSRRSRAGCAANAASSRVMPTSRKRWTTCSSAGKRSRAFSTMAASVSPIMGRSARCAASRSDGNRGCSPARTEAESGQRQCIR